MVSWKIFLLVGILLIGVGLWLAVTGQNPRTQQAEQFLQQRKTITILAGGDVNMGRKTGQQILAGDIDYPFKNITTTLQDADITFVNLESQLADLGGETQSPTSEYRFAGPPESGKSLKNAGIDIVSVANNHMWDYGKARLFETIDTLINAGVSFAGASKNTGEQYKPAIFEMNGRKIAFFAMTTLLNGYEKTEAPKYVSYDSEEEIIAEITALKDTADWIFVSIHTGTEYKQTPNPDMVELSHHLIDAGADVILGGHPHVPQPIENYNGKPIFYSFGNFAFWQPFSFWTQHSFLAKFTLKEPHQVEYDIIPVKAGWQPELATDPEDMQKVRDLLSKVLQ